MSIPPLVCSTPPPPEQCEDDKDHEDFDLSYNLSQEDDEDSTDYNYGNYSYSIYQSKTENADNEKWNSNLRNAQLSIGEEKIQSKEIINGVTSNESIKDHVPKFEERDSIIEDLNLMVNKDIVHSNDLDSKEFETETDVDSECSDKSTRIQDEGGTSIPIQDENTDLNGSTLKNNLSIPNEHDKNFDIITSTIEEPINDLNENSVNELPHMTNEIDEITFQNQVITTSTEILEPTEKASIKINENFPHDADDEFGDFEDFQFTQTSENCQVVSINSENPWENDSIEGFASEFGNFKANFDFTESKPDESTSVPIPCEQKDFQTNTPLEDNDDFGDFDDFRSSDNVDTTVSEIEVASSPEVTLWNLNSPDNDLQIVDTVNNVLLSIFDKEIPESKDELLGKLESLLSETWRHLIDIDVRQPYMINWNNSLGQKILLKALCIDSRNILFGPKWNYNMPKYAVNLSAAPLQPQKQLVQPNSSNAESVEKVTSKEAGAWVDPFTPDGQESCNTENESAPTEKPKRPTDLNVFESETSTKPNQIYSSTISVQPVRHISLPDTHIFTPTDSETPRSKTIHYDTGPSALIPQLVQENINSQPGSLPTQFNEPVDNEYWDFQDFKSSNAVVPPTNISNQPTEETVVHSVPDSAIAKPGITYHTQILQPIKLDPIIPTLNWPDPGEVKETFDDFSDFISSTSWNNEKENQVALDTQKSHIVKNPAEVPVAENVDDEFETFQSASTSVDFGSVSSTVGSQYPVSENATIKAIENCDVLSVKLESNNIKKSNSIILDNQSSSISNNVSDMQDVKFPQSISTDILQPTSASSGGLSRNQHKSDQILQPLSLESYSQINWPNPGIDLQDLSRFNPINSLHSLKNDTNTGGNSKNASPAHNSLSNVTNQTIDDDIWGDFVSSAPKQHPTPKKSPTFADDDEWTDFVSSPSMKSQNGLNTISFNVHTNLSMQKSPSQSKYGPKNNPHSVPLDIPTLNYITPKSNNRGIYPEKHFQNL